MSVPNKFSNRYLLAYGFIGFVTGIGLIKMIQHIQDKKNFKNNTVTIKSNTKGEDFKRKFNNLDKNRPIRISLNSFLLPLEERKIIRDFMNDIHKCNDIKIIYQFADIDGMEEDAYEIRSNIIKLDPHNMKKYAAQLHPLYFIQDILPQCKSAFE